MPFDPKEWKEVEFSTGLVAGPDAYQVPPPPVRAPLEGCRSKIERANEHIKNLEIETAEYLQTNKCSFPQHYDSASDELVLSFANVPVLPLRFSIIVGEAIYQLRSSLDHLVWDLCQFNNGTPASNSGFPIFKSLDGYKSRGEPMIQGVAASAKARIHSLQPLHRPAPTEDALWILREMNNTDKHKLIFVAQAHTGDRVHVSFPDGITSRSPTNDFRLMRIIPENGAEFYRIKTRQTSVKVDVDLAPIIAVENVALAKYEPAIPLLTQLSGAVSNIIKDFAVEFS